MVDRLSRRLIASQENAALLSRQLEIMQERHGYSDEQVDETRKEAMGE